MRIAQVAPLVESVPPKLYGGTERVVAWLCDELVGMGHDVVLFASGDSGTRASLVPVWPRALRLARPRADPVAAEAALIEAITAQVGAFDVVHVHVDWVLLPMLKRASVPFLTTLHGRLDVPGLKEMIRLFPDAPFVSISDHQREPLAGASWLGTVYHGMPLSLFQPRFEPGQYLAFLGRIAPEKGPEAAIRIARAAGLPLRIAAKIPRSEQRYYRERLEPLVDGKQIRLVGEVTDRTKEEFLGNASALLFPIDWPEPFGLVMIEAMACGTPVIAYRRGSVPEVVEEGVTGFVVDGEAAAVAAIRRAVALDRRGVRAGFERRFASRRMAEDYARLYAALVQQIGPLVSARAARAQGSR